MVPHLATSLTGPILSLEQTFLDNQPELEAYLRRKWGELQTPFYGSVDLRMSGFKLAPVDTNCSLAVLIISTKRSTRSPCKR
jgi:glutamate--cysteine ligase